jgi:hypothetical protein
VIGYSLSGAFVGIGAFLAGVGSALGGMAAWQRRNKNGNGSKGE